MLEKIIKDTLSYYLSLDDNSLKEHIKFSNLIGKERVATIDGLEVIIYPNDHLPAHFHVKNKDLRIDAKFTIGEFRLIKGKIGSKDLKRVELFAKSEKGKILLELTWKKYHA